jgi:hypothetical protein
MAPGYRTLTNFELVQKADLIVVARVVDGPDDPFGPRSFVKIEPVKVLKGTLPGDPLMLIGSLKWNGRTVPEMPTPLATSHFSAGMGACIRLFYPKGGLVLAMFQRTDISDKHAHPYSMTPMFEPIARTAEDVEGVDSVWVKAAEAYVSLQDGADAAGLRAAVEARRTALQARPDIASQAMAVDLTHYLDQTGEGKPPVPAQGAQWRMVDLPDESAALLGSDRIKARILRCRAGGEAVQVYWPREEGGVNALRAGGQAFALTPARSDLPAEMQAASATMPFDARLRAALLGGAEEAGLEMTDRTVAARPRDVLQKFALRCQALLKDRPGD